MLLWLVLLACIIFFMYMWNSGWTLSSKPSSGGCGVCGGNNRSVE